jgi:hypothetical protein
VVPAATGWREGVSLSVKWIFAGTHRLTPATLGSPPWRLTGCSRIALEATGLFD